MRSSQRERGKRGEKLHTARHCNRRNELFFGKTQRVAKSGPFLLFAKQKRNEAVEYGRFAAVLRCSTYASLKLVRLEDEIGYRGEIGVAKFNFDPIRERQRGVGGSTRSKKKREELLKDQNAVVFQLSLIHI